MRFFELAQELNTTERDLLKQIEGTDVEISSVISIVDADDEAIIRRTYTKRLAADVARERADSAKALAEKAASAKSILSASIAADAEALDSARQRAQEFLSFEAPLSKLSERAPVAVKKADSVAPATEPKKAEEVKVEVAQVPVEPTKTVEPVAVDPSLPPAAERSIGGIAPLPVRRATAPRPEFVPPKPQPKKQKPAAIHPADEEPRKQQKSQPQHGGLQGAGGVSRLTQKLRNDTEEGRDMAREAQKEKARKQRDKRQAENRVAVAAVEAAAMEKVLTLRGPIVVKDLAERLSLRPNQLITELMKIGILASINQSVDVATAEKIALNHGFDVKHEKKRNSEDKPHYNNVANDDEIPEDMPEQLMPRPPVVTFLGHVDHGKTTLMDCIRKAHVAAGEAGGITQAISAYTVDVEGRKITFLDTPGHAAFSAMRVRGASLTDVAVIIVAADDGVMPQTKEAIAAARQAHVTIMVAITKCDKPTANIMRVMQQLQAENLTPEEWGGTTVCCQVSGVTGEGVGNLLDMILLQSDVLELSANPNRRANGTVIEASNTPGAGPVVNVLVTGGTLSVGDTVLCEEFYGKVRSLTDSTGKRLRTAGPSAAVAVTGLSGVPVAGAEFRVLKNDRRARELAEAAAERKKMEELGATTGIAHTSLDILKQIHDSEKLELSLILRGDVQGSVEAITEAIGQIKSTKVSCKIIQSGTGSISLSDIERAGQGKALIIGFNVSSESGANARARHDGVRIQTFRIIYELLSFVEEEMLALLPVEHKEVVRGHAVVKQVYDLGRDGVVAGSIVNDGIITSDSQIRVIRRGKLLSTSSIATIRHYKEVVKEIKQAQECGIMLTNFRDFAEGDVLESFVFEELPKSL